MFLKLIRCTGMLYCYRSVTYLLRLKKHTVCKNFHFIIYKMIKKKKNDRYNTNYDKL